MRNSRNVAHSPLKKMNRAKNLQSNKKNRKVNNNRRNGENVPKGSMYNKLALSLKKSKRFANNSLRSLREKVLQKQHSNKMMNYIKRKSPPKGPPPRRSSMRMVRSNNGSRVNTRNKRDSTPPNKKSKNAKN